VADAPEVEDRRGFFGKHGGKLVLSLIVGGAFAWVLKAGKMPLTPPRESFANVNWWTVAAYAALWSFVHFVRAVRWHWLLAPVTQAKLRAIIAVSWIGFAAIVLLPLRAGEAVRPLMMRKRSAISGWAATGTIAAERIIDGLFLSLMLLAGLSLTTQLSPLPDHIGSLPISSKIVPRAAYGALVVFAVAFVVMGIFYWRRTWARRMTERVIGAASPKLATWLADRVEHVADGLRFLTDMRYTAPFVALTALYWLLNSAGTMLIARGAGFADFSYGQACVATGVVALGLLVPNAPGFFGAYQLSFYAALAVFYPGDLVVGPGAALVFIVYSVQLLITVGGAGIGALLDPGVTQNLGPDTAENLPRSPSQA
jgi:hypothetical protein